MDYYLILKVLICLFFAVLFLQSGFDKVSDRNGNLEWLKGHFAKSPFRNAVPLLLSVLTLMEIGCGLMSLGAAIVLVFGGPAWVAPSALSACLATLLALFMGQRIAKDYVGAATIATYFGVAVLSLWLILTY